MTTAQPIKYRPEELAEKAYSAYVSSMGGTDHAGSRAVPWQNLPTVQKTAWMAATHVVVTNANAIDGRSGLTEREAELAGESTPASEHAEQEAADQRRLEATAKRNNELHDEKEAKNVRAQGAHR